MSDDKKTTVFAVAAIIAAAAIVILLIVWKFKSKSSNSNDLGVNNANQGIAPSVDDSNDAWVAFSKHNAQQLGITYEAYIGQLQKAYNDSTTGVSAALSAHYPYSDLPFEGITATLRLWAADYGVMAKRELEANGAIDVGGGVMQFPANNPIATYLPYNTPTGSSYNLPQDVITQSAGINNNILSQYGISL